LHQFFGRRADLDSFNDEAGIKLAKVFGFNVDFDFAGCRGGAFRRLAKRVELSGFRKPAEKGR